MDGLNRITNRIADDTERDATELLTHAREDAHAKRRRYQKAAEEKRGTLLALGRAQAQEHVRRTASAAELEARKTLLAVKQELVSEVFEEALSQLMALPSEDYRSFLVRMAVNASLNGSEEILLNEADHTRYGLSVVDDANQVLKSTGRPAALTLSQETLPISGGLVLKAGPVETNCSLEVLVMLARNKLTGEIAKILFEA